MYCYRESIGIDERLDETWVTVFGYVLCCITVFGYILVCRIFRMLTIVIISIVFLPCEHMRGRSWES